MAHDEIFVGSKIDDYYLKLWKNKLFSMLSLAVRQLAIITNAYYYYYTTNFAGLSIIRMENFHLKLNLTDFEGNLR